MEKTISQITYLYNLRFAIGMVKLGRAITTRCREYQLLEQYESEFPALAEIFRNEVKPFVIQA